MKKAILKLWDEVDLSRLHSLIDSIPDRLQIIRKARRRFNKSSELRFDGDASIVKYSDPQKGGKLMSHTLCRHIYILKIDFEIEIYTCVHIDR